MTNFWQKLKKPIFVLAPMANVTDAAFRRVISKYGKPDVIWTEFVSANGLVSPGREVLKMDLRFTEEERPIVAQLFSADPEKMEQAAKLVQEMGFDGLDINMGCPDKTIEKQGAGAAHIKNPQLAKEVIRAAKRGAPNIPVSVKTRVGYNKNEIETWIPELLKEDLAVLTIHARTRKEMSKVPAHWIDVKRVVEIRNEMKVDTLIFGNGDVNNLKEAMARVEETGCDGVMIGRGIFGNPWLWSEHEPTTKEKLLVLVEHTKLFEELMTGVKSFALMKKHYKAYVNGFDGAKELREKLMDAENAGGVEEIIKNFLNSR
jgi:nifR3 family TIM-barrel protein